MRLQTEVWERYSVSQNRAKRAFRKGVANGTDVMLPILGAVIGDSKVAGEVDLGVVEIPVNQIVGLATNRDWDLYTADFSPLSSVNSEYAEAWTRLYMQHMSDTGLVEPIRCYEYLGKFYVLDGKKRVSIHKDQGTMMIKAAVIRIMPEKTEEPHIQRYYEFLKTYEKTGVYQIVFTQPGKVNKFLEDLGFNPDYVWNENDRFSFLFHWYPFESALQRAFDGLLNITTADAVNILLKNHSYEELKNMPSWSLAELMQESWLDMYRIIDPDFQIRIPAIKKAS